MRINDSEPVRTGRPAAGPRLAWPALLASALLATGCGQATDTAPGPPQVVVYCALDREFSEPILLDFARASGARVLPKFDVESTKTVGLTQAILAEAQGGRPVCDLFWNNEILNTLRLQRRGLLAPIRLPSAAAFPQAFRASDGTWYGFAARARILLVNTRLVPQADRPRGIADLAAPRWKGQTGIAKPLFGTTATHAACLFAAWGQPRARAFFDSLQANQVQVLAGNKPVAQAVGSGRLAFGLTDTDDALGELAAGSPVAIIYPDQEPGGLGTLFIPNTLAVIRGAPHQETAVKFASFLLSPAVEARLAAGPSGQIPLNPAVDASKLRVETPRTVRAMDVDFEAAAAQWDTAAAFLLETFGGS